jgi:SAM-dependent methyltransferase
VPAVPAPARTHVAFETWEGRGESLEAIEERIHDGAPVAKLRARAAGYLDTFEALFPDAVPAYSSRILEIGSGVGYVLEEALRRYRPSRAVGLDIAAGMIEFAKQRLHRDSVDTSVVEFVHYDGVNAPIPSESIDLAYSVASLQHAPRPYCFRAITEACRLLAPGGFAWIHLLAYSHFRQHMTPDHYQQELLQQIHEHQGHWHHYYTVEEIETTLCYGIGVAKDDLRVQERSGSLFVCVHKPGRRKVS